MLAYDLLLPANASANRASVPRAAWRTRWLLSARNDNTSAAYVFNSFDMAFLQPETKQGWGYAR
jgi:hypothetical protein